MHLLNVTVYRSNVEKAIRHTWLKIVIQPDVVLSVTMTTSAGSGITLRVDRHPFDTVEVGVDMVGDVSRTGSGATRMCISRTGSGATRMCGVGEYWSDDRRAEERRRSFAALSTSRIRGLAPTIEDIEVDSSDDEDQEEKDPSTRLLSKETLRGDDLYLEEPLPIATTAMNVYSPLEELEPDPNCRRMFMTSCVAMKFISKNLCRSQQHRWMTAVPGGTGLGSEQNTAVEGH